MSKLYEEEMIGSVPTQFLALADFWQLTDGWLKSSAFHHVVTLNPEMIVLAERDEAFRRAVFSADIRTPDGAGLIWARWYLRSSFWPLWPSLLAFLWQRVERVSGVEMVHGLARQCQERGVPLYCVGGHFARVRKVAEQLRSQFDGLEVFVSPEHAFDLAGPDHVVGDIRSKQPGVLLVAYGAPKQTYWIEAQREKLSSVRIAAGVGGAFDILSEHTPRAPGLLRKINLEWLWRLYLEPHRLPRIKTAVMRFPLLMRKYKQG